MKRISMLTMALLVTACAGTPPTAPDAGRTAAGASASQSTSAATTPAAASKPAATNTSGQVAATAKTKRVCQNDDSTGSRLKRPRCYDVPEGTEKATQGDLLRDKMDEFRQYNEENVARTTENVFNP